MQKFDAHLLRTIPYALYFLVLFNDTERVGNKEWNLTSIEFESKIYASQLLN